MVSKSSTSTGILGKEFIRRLLPRGISHHRIFGGPLKGRAIYTSWHDYPRAILGWAETDLLNWFRNNIRADETWLDVGAFHGYTAIAMSTLVGANGRIFAFEPSLTAASALYQTKVANDLSQLIVIPLALGKSPCVKILEASSFRGMSQPAQSFCAENSENFQFLTTSLDYIWASISGDKKSIDGLKLDVQGFEVDVLRGMKLLLKEHHPKLVIEVHSGVDREELLQVLEECGYSRAAVPIEPMPDETYAMFNDDRNYEFVCRQDQS